MNDNEFNKALGAVLRSEREKRDLSIYDIGARIGVSGAAVSLWEHGRRSMSAVSLKRYCDVLGLSIDDIFRKVQL